MMKKKERFKWTGKCVHALSKMKALLVSLPILTCPTISSPLYLYLYITYQTLISILVQETYKVNRPVYFVRKVFKGTEDRYQKIKRLTLVAVVTTRKLSPYFKGTKYW